MNVLNKLIIAAISMPAVNLWADPPVDIKSLYNAPLSINGAHNSLDGERIAPKRIGGVSPGEVNSVLKQGTLLTLLKDKSVAGLDLFGAPLESSLSAAVYYRVYIEEGVLKDVGKLTHLEYLNLYHVDLTRGVGLRCLTKLDNLRVLRLTNCKVEIKQILAHLPTCPNLEIVKVWNDKFQWPDDSERFQNRQVITATETAKFTSGSPKLKALFLESTERYEPEAIAQFAKLVELNYLHIRTVDNMPAESVKIVPQQRSQGERLEKLFRDNRFKRWRNSSQRLTKSYTLPHTSIYVPQLDDAR
jgi:hypothetical protein